MPKKADEQNTPAPRRRAQGSVGLEKSEVSKPRRKPGGVTLPDISHLRVFVEVAAHLDRQGEERVSLNEAARNAREPISSVSYALSRLEELYGVELVNRDKERREATLTADGRHFLKKARGIIEQCLLLGDGEKSTGVVEVVIGTTETLQSRFCSSAVLAARLRCQRGYNRVRVAIRVEPLNHPVVLRQLRDGTCDVGLLWGFPSPGAQDSSAPSGRPDESGDANPYPDIEFIPVFDNRKIPFVLLTLPRPRDLGLIPNGFADLLEAVPNRKVVEIAEGVEFANAFAGVRLALVETEPHDKLRARMQEITDVTRTVVVGGYEEGLANVRQSTADVCYAPIWYGWREGVESRRIAIHGTEFGRDVVLCRRKAGGKVEDLDADLQNLSPQGAVTKVIRDFLRDHQERLTGAKSIEKPKKDRHPVGDILEWATYYAAATGSSSAARPGSTLVRPRPAGGLTETRPQVPG
ncbi:MAG: hypothetical protein C0501_06585 [Isosphaera sp.]|nr:hypothetical protein [Isosphaera sp.]